MCACHADNIDMYNTSEIGTRVCNLDKRFTSVATHWDLRLDLDLHLRDLWASLHILLYYIYITCIWTDFLFFSLLLIILSKKCISYYISFIAFIVLYHLFKAIFKSVGSWQWLTDTNKNKLVLGSYKIHLWYALESNLHKQKWCVKLRLVLWVLISPHAERMSESCS